MSKFVEANEKIAEGVVKGYKKIEDGVVGGYKKIETGVVEGFGKVTDNINGFYDVSERTYVPEGWDD